MIGGWKYERRNSVRDGGCCRLRIRTRGSLEQILEVPRERGIVGVVRGGVEQPASMPLVRYEVRCEYSLANPELYHSAARDDPEALLEGVAMAGLVGIVRQLGDLAEYAPLPLLPLNLVLTVLDIDIGQGLGDGSGP